MVDYRIGDREQATTLASAYIPLVAARTGEAEATRDFLGGGCGASRGHPRRQLTLLRASPAQASGPRGSWHDRPVRLRALRRTPHSPPRPAGSVVAAARSASPLHVARLSLGEAASRGKALRGTRRRAATKYVDRLDPSRGQRRGSLRAHASLGSSAKQVVNARTSTVRRVGSHAYFDEHAGAMRASG